MNNQHREGCPKNATCITHRWIRADGRIVYSNDPDTLGEVKSSGHYQRCTNTVEYADDLCDFSDPNQYLPWQSHNQPHKG